VWLGLEEAPAVEGEGGEPSEEETDAELDEES